MCTTYICYFSLSWSIYPHSLFSPLFISPSLLLSTLHPQHCREPVFAHSCLSFVPPSIPPFLFPASQPSCNPLPSPSLGAPLWLLGSAASASPAVCSLALLCSLSQTQHSLPSGLKGGEGKHFKLQAQPGKQDSTEYLHVLAMGIKCSQASIDLFIWRQNRHLYLFSVSFLVSLHLSSLSHPLFHFK